MNDVIDINHNRQRFMVDKPPEPKGVAGEQGLFMAVNRCLFSTLIGPCCY